MSSGICPNCGNITDFTNIPQFTKIKCTHCDTELIVPMIFGEFQLTKLLEEHIFFKKYNCTNLRTDKNYTITILNKKFDGFRECINICRKEAKDICNVLEHERIVPILEYGEVENTFYIIEPQLKHFKLSEYSPEKLGEFEAESVFNAFKAIGMILRDAHHKNFIHHNICPDNIIIDNEGNVKIQNIFISRVEYNYYLKTRIGFNSSVYYISPEKAEKAYEEDKGDVFSLGVTLYYILTGKYPFDGEKKEQIIYSRIKRESATVDYLNQVPYTPPIRIDIIRNDIAPEYADLIDSMLKPYPVQRPTAAKFVTSLNLIEAAIEKEKKFKIYNNIKSPSQTVTTKTNPDLKKALKNHELTLHYQPIVNIKTKKIIGAEAFLRWITPVGAIPPTSFLPEAERNELIHDLGAWAIEESCKQLSQWHKMGFNDFYITVNISPAQLQKEGFETNFSNIITRNNIDYKLIEFEISQTPASEISGVPVEQYTKFTKFFNSRFSIAELGSKYSSIQNQLSNLRLHSLKIDSDYISNIKKAKKQIETFNSIIAFANFLSVPTVAEKVETKRQLNFLSKIGCTLAQGYYFHHPLPKDEVTKLLNKQK